MGKCHLHLGSNTDDPAVQIARAIQYIEVEIGPIVASSSWYKTAAWGLTDQPDFINMAIEVEHYMTPTQLLSTVNKIEDVMGRRRVLRWGPRCIDIDILLIEDIVIETTSLTVPHRLLHQRNFVLFPLAEIAGEVMHPVLRMTIDQLKGQCEDQTEVHIIDQQALKP